MIFVELAGLIISLVTVLSVAGFFAFLSIRQAIKRKNYVSRLNDHDKGVIAEYLNILWN